LVCELSGFYFSPGSTHCAQAAAQISSDGMTLIVTGNGALLAAVPLANIQVSSRLGALNRKLEFPDGGLFETRDNDGVDALLKGRSGALAWMERSWRLTLAALAVVAAGSSWLAYYGVPMGAHWLALRTPSAIIQAISNETLSAMGNRVLLPTRLPDGRRNAILARFHRVASWQPLRHHYALLFHDAPVIGPNAFAMPDGQVVITDQLANISHDDQELDGIFAHEMAHVNRAHSLQSVYQASLVPAAIAFVTGDAGQIGHIAAILPGIMLQSAYSRRFEQQADDDANRELRAHGEDPGRLADLLQRLEQATCSKGGCLPSWLGSHPATEARVLRLRHGMTH
jgi:Zn-dependent protease with chaperone function